MKEFNTYPEAAKNRKANEMTIYDTLTNKYKNVKVWRQKQPWEGDMW